jgi:sugar phosphate isomerase/epimerase
MISRRHFLHKTSLAGLGMLYTPSLFGYLRQNIADFNIHIFSKHLQWLNYESLAEEVKRMGFKGVDLTVRPGGHVEPERVKEDLPRAIEHFHKKGLVPEMITTAIQSVESPYAEEIISTASKLGIKYYRMGWIKYNPKSSHERDLKRIEKQFRNLAELNAAYKINASYQNHAGSSMGADIWDLWMVLKEIQSPYLGSQYDLRHAMVEGLNSWKTAFERIMPYINTLVVKDYQYTIDKKGKHVAHVALNDGIVPWMDFFKLLKKENIKVPISLHCEYPLGGAEKGKRDILIPGEQVLDATKKDLDYLKTAMYKSAE